MTKRMNTKWATALCLIFAALCAIGFFFRIPASAEVPDTCETCAQPYVNGFCSCEGEASYQPIAKNTDGAYEIGNAGQLYRFAAMINNAEFSEDAVVDAVITADITVNERVTENGAVVSDTSSLRAWEPIVAKTPENEIAYFLSVNLDGGGHVISGLYFTYEEESYDGVALFGALGGGSISRLGITDSVMHSAQHFHTSSFVGIADNVTISDCFSTALVIGSSYYCGGLVGEGSSGTVIENSYFGGKLVNGGIISGNAIVCDYYPKETVRNCYYIEDAETGSPFAVRVSAEQVASGYLTYCLNGGVTDGSQAWYQTVGEGAPAFRGATVYASQPCYSEFANSAETLSEKAHSFTLPEGYDNTHHWEAVCENCGERSNTAGHEIDNGTDACSCGFVPDFKVMEQNGTVTYHTNIDSLYLTEGATVYLLKSLETNKTLSISSDGSAVFDLAGHTLTADIYVYSPIVFKDSSYNKEGVLNGYVFIYSSETTMFFGVTFGASGCIYLSGGSAATMLENVVIEPDDLVHPASSEGKVIILSAELENGLSLNNSETLASLLTDGGYFTDASGNKITLTEGQNSIEEKAYIKTSLFSVTVGDSSSEYSDVHTAFDSIGEQDTATVTLLRDINLYDEAGINVRKGSVILDLAGHTIKETVIWVDAGAALTIEDSSAEKSGGLTAPQAITGIMVQDGAIGLTIRSGNINSSISACAPVEIDGGSFGRIAIDSKVAAATVTVKDGSFEELILYSSTEENCVISITGGSYGYLDLRGCTLADVLSENYLPQMDDGTFVTDLSKTKIRSAHSIVAHTHSYTLQNNETEHYYICACGLYDGEPASHEGGVPTCELGAICEVCLFEYINPLGHAWDDGVITVQPGCETPGEITYTCQNDSSHTYTDSESPIGHAWDDGVITKESTCAVPGEITYTCQNDSTHIYTEETELAEHSFKDFICEACGAKAAFGLLINNSNRYVFMDDVATLESYLANAPYNKLKIVLGRDLILEEGDASQLILSNGEITLDLAGHRMEGYALFVLGAHLTVTDSSEEASGALVSEESSILIGVIGEIGTLTVNGGSLQGIINVMTGYENSGYSRLSLNSGKFSVHIVGDSMDLHINGGEFTDLTIYHSGSDGAAGNKVSIRGGSFTNISSSNSSDGGTLADILSDAPCILYTVAEGSPVIDRMQSEYTGTFTVSHDDSHASSDSYEKDNLYHWIECENGVQINTQEHTYGNDALCGICLSQAPYVVSFDTQLHGFASFEEALRFAKAYDGARLTLYQDTRISYFMMQTLSWSYTDLTVDLNGYDLILYTQLSLENTSLTFTDSSAENTGTLAFYYAEVRYGTLLLSDVNISSIDAESFTDLYLEESDLVLDGAHFSDTARILSEYCIPFFVEAVFEDGLIIESNYSLAYIFTTECLDVTDANGDTAVFEDYVSQYDGVLNVKHSEIYALTEWRFDNEGRHARYCLYCGLVSDSGECTGGEATCESGPICETCGDSYGEPLGHILQGDRCTSCGIFAPITVIADGEKKHFLSAVEAFAWADGFSTATIVLNGDYSLYEDDDIEFNSADIILDLNGYEYDIREMNLYGGSLTVKDSSVHKKGSFYADSTLDVYNGILILESGNYHDIYIDLDPDESGFSASVAIVGGFFDYINIETDYEGELFIEISGGEFETLELEIDDPTHVSVSGGEMQYIYTYDGTYLYYLADIINVYDCVKMLDENGRRIYFEEEQEQTHGLVRFVHDPSADADTQLRSDGMYHWYECECGVINGKTRHSGGTATCSELAVCEVCEEKYGRYLSHTYGEALTCSVCGHVADGVVKVQVGAYTEYFDTLGEAIDFANEFGGNAKITLLNNIDEEYIEAYYLDFSLDLNGYTFSFDYMEIGDANILIVDGSTMQTGKFLCGEGINIYEGSLEIQGGNCETLSVWMDTMYSGATFKMSGGSIEMLYIVDYKYEYIDGTPRMVLAEISGGSIGELWLEMSSLLTVRMTGGRITDGVEINRIGNAEAKLGNILPYTCYSFVDENGEKISDIADLCSYSGYLAVVHVDTTEIKHNSDTHYNECLCGLVIDSEPHTYDNVCDTTCNVCAGERIPAEHAYDNICDATCNVCGTERTPAEHVYDNACDATCNVCDGERAPAEHVYDNGCDATCNVCGTVRASAAHVYGNMEVTTESTHHNAGAGTAICEECGAEAEIAIPKNSGLSGGAVAAITAGSTVTVAAGGFALFWFVIKKKKWSA